MYGTMQDFPLTITAIMRHGCGVHRRTVTTATGEAIDTVATRCGQRAGQLANALRRPVLPGTKGLPRSCVEQHRTLATYFCGSCRWARQHTLNIRLFPEQIAYVTNEAEDCAHSGRLAIGQTARAGAAQTRHRAYRDRGGEGDTTPEAGKTVLRSPNYSTPNPRFGQVADR